MKYLKWIWDNILFLISLFLLAFIPLYPKWPLLDIKHTWVYVRLEDFVVVFVILLWVTLLFAKKITFKTPLTMSIITFWIVGVVSTIHGVLLIFPILGGSAYPNVAFLSYLRRIEYISLFFVGYCAIKDKRFISYIVIALAVTLLLVAGYGFGQKFYGFPAYLTMNEEFSKGIPLQLSSLSRISSTFGGHYDLAAYLVLIIPILASMIFGFRNLFAKLSLLITVSLGFALLFTTVSRSSFFVILPSLFLMLLFHKKKLAVIGAISFFVVGLIFLSFSTSLLQRFGSTIKEIDVLVNAKTGEAIGHVKQVPAENFKNKVIIAKPAQTAIEINAAIADKKDDGKIASESSRIVYLFQLPPTVPVVIEPNSPTGENLPQGTGYVNLPLTPITKKVDLFFYQESNDQSVQESGEELGIQGNFLIKRVMAYDLSFTTRFQGEWPKAISLFKENILFGSGYSSTGLAVDNNYLRILGEVGLMGFLSYFAILLSAVLYIKKVLPQVNNPIIKSFAFGFLAGLFGLSMNAVFIDVFEASKIAFVLWLLVGITIGTLHLYQNKEIDIYKELRRVASSRYAIVIYLFITVFVGFSTISNYYFTGDDFTWLRWIADCDGSIVKSFKCQSVFSTIISYFTDANGFFYRPGTKIFFHLMYTGFWLNQTMYHVVSIFLHFIVAVLLFLLARKILKNYLLSCIAAFLFVILSGFSEAVFWISSIGFLFNAVFILLGLLFFIVFKEKKKNIYLVFSVFSIALSLLFHELGIVAPLLIILYEIVIEERLALKEVIKKFQYLIIFFPILPYLLLRFLANSHWFSGDYNYNLLKLPFNIFGNVIGYLMLDLFGPTSLSMYQLLRNFSKDNIFLVSFIFILIFFIIVYLHRIIVKRITGKDKKIIVFGILFFVISLLPFLALGNITSRYSYLSSIGFIIIFVFFLNKAYDYLMVNGKQIAVATAVMMIGVFALMHIIQLQKVHGDWKGAGEKVNTFLISLNGIYTNSWTTDPMDFYFINVPIRHGDAWVLPVGLEDAMWFVFRNDKLNVHIKKDLNSIPDTVNTSLNTKIFEFNDDGSISEILKIKKTN